MNTACVCILVIVASDIFTIHNTHEKTQTLRVPFFPYHNVWQVNMCTQYVVQLTPNYLVW